MSKDKTLNNFIDSVYAHRFDEDEIVWLRSELGKYLRKQKKFRKVMM